MTALLCAIFFVSGLSALVFETLWFRQAGLAFGNSVWASTLVLSGFMGGLAAGNAIAARYGHRVRSPMRTYALAEVAIAVTGIALVYGLPSLGVALAPWLRPLLDRPLALNALRLFAAFVVLAIPSTAMGITLPLLTRALAAYDARFGSVLGRLYGWNTLGAVAGVLAGELLLIGLLGVRGTAAAAGALNVIAAAAAAWLSARAPAGAAQTTAASSIPGAPAVSGRGRWLVAAAVTGFCLLALEVFWFRLILLVVMGHSLAFALMLSVVLSGIALGGLAAGRWLRRSPLAFHAGAPLVAAAGVLCVVTYGAFPFIIRPFEDHLVISAWEILRVAVPLMLPVSLLSGAFFTLAGAALRPSFESDSGTTGALTLANTAGAALGSLAGGFVLLPLLGVERSLFVIAVLYAAVAAWLFMTSALPRPIVYTSLALGVVALALFPFGTMDGRLVDFAVRRYAYLRGNANGDPAGLTVAAVHEGVAETVIYFEMPMLGRPMFHALYTNAISMADTEWVSRRYMKLYAYWPIAVHPDPKRALLIAYGVGNTAKALTDSRGLERIDVVDISRDVVDMGRIVYPTPAEQPLRDPRVRLHIEDGRYFLQTTDQRFDLITSEPPPPQSAGTVNLYTREYFQLLYNRLAEGGIVAYWLPAHAVSESSTLAILRGFCDAFEDCSLWNAIGSQLMMVGTRHAAGPVSEEQFARQWHERAIAAEMRQLGFEVPEQLGALFIGDATYLNDLTAGVKPLDDNHPKRIEGAADKAAAAQVTRSLGDVVAARERFRRSPLIARLWPARWREASLPYFEIQGLINTWARDVPSRIEDVDRVLNASPLKTAVLWLTGSDADFQRVVVDAEPAALAHPAVQFHLGLRLLSERSYAAAVGPLGRAEQLPALRSAAFRYRVYALCLSGQVEEARRLANERRDEILGEARLASASDGEAEDGLPPFWRWMQGRFGIL